MKEKSYKFYEMFLKALCNKTRFEIIMLLKEGPKNVMEISNTLKYEQSRISHNLKKLESCGFVNQKSKGKLRIYNIETNYINPILKNIEKYKIKYQKKLKDCPC